MFDNIKIHFFPCTLKRKRIENVERKKKMECPVSIRKDVRWKIWSLNAVLSSLFAFTTLIVVSSFIRCLDQYTIMKLERFIFNGFHHFIFNLQCHQTHSLPTWCHTKNLIPISIKFITSTANTLHCARYWVNQIFNALASICTGIQSKIQDHIAHSRLAYLLNDFSCL